MSAVALRTMTVPERRHAPKPDSAPTPQALRRGAISDLIALEALEQRAFSTDRLLRRSFRQFLTSPNAALLVAGVGRNLSGYALVLFRSGSDMARLYSLAVDPQHRGHGSGSMLLAAAEGAARSRGCRVMRLEVREDNAAARLYHRHGYRKVKRIARYYEDGSAAFRLQKPLQPSEAGLAERGETEIA